MKKKRIDIPVAIAVSVLYKSDHCCCICRDRSAPAQIHHIDENPSNNTEENLVVLCANDQGRVHSKSNIGRSYSVEEVLRYKKEWEADIASARAVFEKPGQARIVRFDGKDIDTVYLEVRDNTLRAFQDPWTFRLMGFEWGNVDIYPEETLNQFNIDRPLQRIFDCKQIRLVFNNGKTASEVFIVWEGRRHHIPNIPTLAVVQGVNDTNKINWKQVANVNLMDFNAIPKGKPILSVLNFVASSTEDGSLVFDLHR